VAAAQLASRSAQRGCSKNFILSQRIFWINTLVDLNFRTILKLFLALKIVSNFDQYQILITFLQFYANFYQNVDMLERANLDACNYNE